MLLTPSARIAVIGAGVSGVVTARALLAEGFDVTVFEKTDDLGGVWSRSRAYPGISTQDDRVSYAFSDMPMPADAALHPTGAEVRGYLEQYALRAGVLDRIRLSTAVRRATLAEGRTWLLETDGPDGSAMEEFDWLVAANGTFSTPFVPKWPGRDEFEAAGGRVLEPGQLGDGTAMDGKRVVVVGWGKTGCDIAVVAADRAASTALIARSITWKYPKRLGLGRLTYRDLVLTRAGQHLLWNGYRDATGRLLLRKLPGLLPREVLFRVLGRAVDRSSGLSRSGLKPAVKFGRSHSLTTDGFFDAVAAERIAVHRDVSVSRLVSTPDGPAAELSDGRLVPADVVVAATGYDQVLDFIDPTTLAEADRNGALRLYQRVLALDVPRLAVAGWMYNYHSPLTAEIAAKWLAEVLAGRADLPARPEQEAHADRYPLIRRTESMSSTERLPGLTIDHLDEMLDQAGAPLPKRIRRRQWWRPLDPAQYAESLQLNRRAHHTDLPEELFRTADAGSAVASR